MLQGALGIGRTLFQEDTVSYVTTAEELLAAVERGDPHIEVVGHLDFSGIPPTPVGTEDNNTGTVNVLGKVRSIRVCLWGELPFSVTAVQRESRTPIEVLLTCALRVCPCRNGALPFTGELR